MNNSDKEVDEVDAALSDLEITLEGGKTSTILVRWIFLPISSHGKIHLVMSKFKTFQKDWFQEKQISGKNLNAKFGKELVTLGISYYGRNAYLRATMIYSISIYSNK